MPVFSESQIGTTVCRETTCRHLGELSRLAGCESCGGNVQVKVFVCAVHTECTVGKTINNLACCATCEQFTPGNKKI